MICARRIPSADKGLYGETSHQQSAEGASHFRRNSQTARRPLKPGCLNAGVSGRSASQAWLLWNGQSRSRRTHGSAATNLTTAKPGLQATLTLFWRKGDAQALGTQGKARKRNPASPFNQPRICQRSYIFTFSCAINTINTFSLPKEIHFTFPSRPSILHYSMHMIFPDICV